MIKKEFYNFVNNPENWDYLDVDWKLKKARELLGVRAGDDIPVWGDFEEDFLRDNYLKASDQVIASYLGFNVSYIKYKRKKLGLMKRNNK